MKIGIPKEIKPAEKKGGSHPLRGKGADPATATQVFLEAGAGAGSGFDDQVYQESGAVILQSADDVWAEAEMVLKVKEPIDPEFGRMKPGQILFTYLHLAADPGAYRQAFGAQGGGGGL